MPDIISEPDEDFFDDWGAANQIGAKVVEMADRLRPIHAVAPGAVAKWTFEMDGVRYAVSMAVEQSKPEPRDAVADSDGDDGA